MKYFLDNTKVKLEDLRNSGIYDAELLDELEKGHFNKLKVLTEEHTENIDYMEPILYAMYDKFGTYEVYEYYGDKLKDYLRTETRLAEKIIVTNPELIENTPISENKELILKYKEMKPEIIQYISPKLENDREFLVELCNSNDADVIREAVEKYSAEKIVAVNPELRSNKDFMAAAISQDISNIKYADKSMLNNYDVFREASVNNAEVINYVIDNSKSVGLEAILGTRDTAKEKADKSYMDVISENAEKGTSKRFEWVKKAVENHGTDHPVALNVMIGTAAKSDELDPALVDKAIDYALLSKVRLEKIMEEEKDYKISHDEYRGLVRPCRVNKLIEKSQKELSPETQQKWEEYVKFYDEFREKYMEQRKEKAQTKDANEKAQDKVEDKIEEKSEEKAEDIPNEKSKEDKLLEAIRGHDKESYGPACEYAAAARAYEKLNKNNDKDKVFENIR